MDRWRKPLIPDRVEPDGEHVWHDGRNWRHDVLISYPDSAINRFREGSACYKCQEPLPEGVYFPDKCPLCKYEIKKNQLKDFAKTYQGVNEIGRSMKPELDRLDQEHERNLWTPGSHIRIERDV